MKKIILFFLLVTSLFVDAQGDGARQLLWGPTGATSVVAKWMHMNQNVLPGDIYIKNANVEINAFPVSFVYNFGLAGQFAQVMATPIFGNVTGTIYPDVEGVANPSQSSSWLADSFVSLKWGLVNQPALNVKDFMAHEHKTFSMMSYVRFWIPGSYDSKKAVNLGSNRFTFDLGLPMNIYLSKKNPKRATWLEVYPRLQIFTPNNDPTNVSLGADQVKQRPLFSLENHLSHNLTKKFWAAADLRYQYGGETETDGVEDGNAVNAFGGGATVAYQLSKPLILEASYGTVFTSPDNVESNLLKITMVFTYINMKKLQHQGEEK